MINPHPDGLPELFEIKLEHIKPNSLIWNKLMQKWIPAPQQFITKLLKLIEARSEVRLYRENLHNPFNEQSMKVYNKLLNAVTSAREELRNRANLFCILHEGYSLN